MNKAFLLLIASYTSHLLPAAKDEPKIINGTFQLESTMCQSPQDDFAEFAFKEVVCAITGEHLDDIDATEMKKNLPMWITKIREITKLPLEDNPVLMPFVIQNTKNEETQGEHTLTFTNEQYKQRLFGDKYLYVSRFLPYRWFCYAKEGQAIEIPLRGGAFKARLILTSHVDYPFNPSAADAVTLYWIKQRKSSGVAISKAEEHVLALGDAISQQRAHASGLDPAFNEEWKSVIRGLNQKRSALLTACHTSLLKLYYESPDSSLDIKK